MAKAAKKSKKFVVAREGATVDGRTIDRTWIQQMAANYDPATYTASINMEHIRGVLPDSPFRSYGVVNALEQRDNAAGLAELLATITPTDDLVQLNAKGQKLFTSIEVSPNFAATGEAYLVGLAVTDNPASLGTSMLEFSAAAGNDSPLARRKQAPENYFSVATEVTLEFIEDAPPAAGLLEKVKAIFARKNASDDQRFSDVHSAIEEIAEHGATQSRETDRQFQQVDESIRAHSTDLAGLAERLGTLEEAFASTPARRPRPLSSGSPEQLTDC